MGLICQISDKNLHSSEPGETEEVVNVANQFCRGGNKHSS